MPASQDRTLIEKLRKAAEARTDPTLLQTLIEKLRPLAEKATPGPWEAENAAAEPHEAWGLVAANGRCIVLHDFINQIDAEYIAAIDPQTILALCDALTQGQADRRALEAERERDEALKVASIRERMIDIPTAWELTRATDREQHHEKCSWRVAGMLCDCAAARVMEHVSRLLRRSHERVKEAESRLRAAESRGEALVTNAREFQNRISVARRNEDSQEAFAFNVGLARALDEFNAVFKARDAAAPSQEPR